MQAVVVVGLALGVLAGWRFKLMHRAWVEWRKTAASIPGLRKVFWGHGWLTLLWLVALIVVVWLI